MEKQSKSISKNFLYLLLFIFLLFNSNTFGREKTIDKNESINKTSSTNVGDIIVKKWAGDKKSALSFSFDDSYQTHYINVRPILNQFGFPGTFYLIADLINDDHPAQWRYGVWPQFLEMAQEGHEMAAHTMTHPNLTGLNVGDETTPGTIKYELYQSKIIIEEKIEQDVISMAYPFTEHNATVDNITSLYYENGRAMGSQPNSSSLFGNQWFSLTAKEPEFNLPRKKTKDDNDELNEYKNYLLNSINNEKWTIFFGHEVLPFSNMVDSLDEMYLPISNEWLLTFT
ncbi:MAG: polysaccharide deacetylase family protein, partial [Bacteroidetes bacterium]|nr:polysaccharide deacetylase family protein [Bacteroidota bacterium]